LPLLLMPSLVEEAVFRALLLPHPLEGVAAPLMGAWIALSVGLFVLLSPTGRQPVATPGS